MIEASFDPKKTNAASVAGAVQYDTGQRLRLCGLPSPEELTEKDDLLSGDTVTVEVQYAYEGDANTEARLATYDEDAGCWTVAVPDVYLTKSYPVGFFVYVSYGATDESQRTKTMYTGAFTPKGRPAPNEAVTPDQLDAWTALVGEVNLAISSARTAASNAQAAASSATEAAKKATEAYDKISAYEMDSVKSVNGVTPGEDGSVTIQIGVAGAPEGNLPTFDADGDLVASDVPLNTVMTSANFVLEGSTLYITTAG